ncbi:DNA topoisomerase VI subunit A [Planctomycetes bacterium Pla163]|uniref:DNA topoisomerase (ATP-hydrolyzing) n=1 Tax=Rohdeia mirabilis TaxID=2528008 RepID=A0A518CZB3_9BACT|nr:DNA topoisomerase VI subunit A [Planctomycetes bacterium Pla163]
MAKKAAKKVAKKTTAKKRAALTSDDGKTLQLIDATADRVRRSIDRRILPELKFPVRSLSNVSYTKATGYFELGKGRKARALSVNTVKSFAQTLRLMSLSKEMVENDDFATKREAYYVSKNWGECRFKDQPESDTVMDDIEAMASLDGLSREQLRYRPEEHGGALAGELVVIDRDKETGAELRIDCTQMGSGAYTIPSSVEHLGFETKAKFILAIETAGMFNRLNDHAWWRKAGAIIISMGGVPSRAQRRFVRRLSDEHKLPVYCFVDCDPYGIGNIYRTLKVGSGNAAHINRFFCVPRAQYLGVTPQDIMDFQLEDATHPLQPVDIKRAKDALKNDPFFKSHKPWVTAINQMLKMGVRAEQQALAKWGLNFVIEEYLPRKLKDKKSFLP